MEIVFFCGECQKFFYADAKRDQMTAVCTHCQSDATINCRMQKEEYLALDDDGKNQFKSSIRRRYPDRDMLVNQYKFWQETQALESFVLTTGYSFDGYVVTEYVDVLFDEMLVGLGLGKSLVSGFDNLFSFVAGSEATTMINKLNDVKTELKQRLMRKAVRMGANALLGIDFESSKLGDLLMVSMTGTAVKIEKIEG